MSKLTEAVERELVDCEKVHENWEKTADRVVAVVFRFLNMTRIKVHEATHSCEQPCQGCESEGYNTAVEDIERFK